MSAILKALKKLEDQTADGFDPTRSGPAVPKETFPEHAIHKFRRPKPVFWAVVTAALGALAASGFWFYRTLPAKPGLHAAASLETGINAVERSQPGTRQVPRMSQQPLPVKPKAPAPTQVLSYAKIPVLEQAKLPGRKLPVKLALPDSKPSISPKSDAPPVGKPAEEMSVLDNNKPSPPFSTSKTFSDKVVKGGSSPEVLRDSSLRIQAIAWAEDPQRRIAVINGRILHEGEMVDDFFVRNIQPDAIEVKQGEKLWTIEFKIN